MIDLLIAIALVALAIAVMLAASAAWIIKIRPAMDVAASRRRTARLEQRYWTNRRLSCRVFFAKGSACRYCSTVGGPCEADSESRQEAPA